MVKQVLNAVVLISIYNISFFILFILDKDDEDEKKIVETELVIYYNTYVTLSNIILIKNFRFN